MRPRYAIRSSRTIVIALVALSSMGLTGAGCTLVCAPSNPGGPPGTARLAPGDYDRSLTHDGETRTYKLHVPPQASAGQALPLVFMLHGGTGTAAGAARYYGWNEKADAAGFLVAYPQGKGLVPTWNSGHCCGSALRDNVDDVGFVATIVDDLRPVANLDDHRIYATGMSNGGMLSHWLGARRSDLFAAIGPVAGSIGGQPSSSDPVVRPPMPDHPVAVIIIHGIDDHNVLYNGGQTMSGLASNRFDLPVSEAVQFWVTANNCEPVAIDETLPNGLVKKSTHAHRGNGADVVLYSVTGLGHAWPGGQRPFIGADDPGHALSATDTIWQFFSDHPKP